jgi:hypothetical protein
VTPFRLSTQEDRFVAKTTHAKVQVDRRVEKDRRKSGERRKSDNSVAVERRKGERRKVQRRRQIDPTTCERDYTPEEIEFMQALDAYKRANGRMFPTCSEILEVIRDMGYVRQPKGEAAESVPETDPSSSTDSTSDAISPDEATAATTSEPDGNEA